MVNAGYSNSDTYNKFTEQRNAGIIAKVAINNYRVCVYMEK